MPPDPQKAELYKLIVRIRAAMTHGRDDPRRIPGHRGARTAAPPRFRDLRYRKKATEGPP